MSGKMSEKPATKKAAAKPVAAMPVLLAGGNPQIAKADGDAPVQAYIAAMPGWKSDVGRRLDALIVRTVPGVRKAVKWNSPLYGVEGHGWFLGIHCFTKYVKVTFFRGTSLHPVPPGKRLGLAQAKRQHAFDCQVGIQGLATRGAPLRRCPARQRVLIQPEREVAAPPQPGFVGRPVRDVKLVDMMEMGLKH